jgi:hypothetical protein
MRLAKLKDGWRWLKEGEETNPKIDYHVWPRYSGKDLVAIKETFVVSKAVEGMVVRNEGSPTIFITQPNILAK